MSASGISGSTLFAGYNLAVQNKFQQFQQGFQQLGQALQTGNLSQAQTDFAALQQGLPGQQQITTQSGSQSTNSISQVFSQLAQDLKSGNLSAAQSDFSTFQQDLHQLGNGFSLHGHHHRTHAESSQGSTQQNAISTLFGTLGQDLQAGNLTAAQQTYSTLQQDFLQFAGTGSSGSNGSNRSLSGNTSLNVSA